MITNLFPPAVLPNALPLTVSGQVLLPLAMSNGWVTVAQYDSLAYNSYIAAYGITVRDAAYLYTGSIQFRITIDEAPIQDGTALGFWTNERGSVATPIPSLIFVSASRTLRLQCRRAVIAGAAQEVAMLATGLRFPQEVRLDPAPAQHYRPDMRG